MQTLPDMPAQPPGSTQQCPQCGATMPVHEGFITWCDACGWNLEPIQTDPPSSLLEALYLRLNKRLSRNLFTSIIKVGDLRPRWTPTKLMAFFFAACVHLITLLLLVLGLALIIQGWPNIMAIAFGALALGAVWILRPRLPKLDKDDIRLSHHEAPTLFGLLDRIADTLGARKVETVVVCS